MLLLTLFCLVSLPVGHSQAQNKAVEDNKTGQQESVEDVQTRIDALGKRIAASRMVENQLTAQQFGVSLEKLAERTQTLEATRSALERLKTELEKGRSQAEEASALKERLQGAPEVRVTEAPPYNLSFYDGLMDELATLEQQQTAASAAQALSKRSLQSLTDRLEKSRQKGRSLNEKIGNAADGVDLKPLKYNFLLVELEQELLSALISYENVYQENLAGKIQLLQLEADNTRQKIAWVASHLYYDEDDLEKHLDAIRARQKNLESELQKLAQGRDKIETSLRAARQRLSSPDETASSTLEAKVRELQAWRDFYQTGMEMTAAEIQLLDDHERLWKTRYAVAGGNIDLSQMVKLRSEIKERLNEVGKLAAMENRRRDAIRSRIALLEKELDDEETAADVRPVVDSTLSALRRLLEQHSDYTSALLSDEQLRLRIVAETAPDGKKSDFRAELAKWWDVIRNIWSIEVWVIDNNPVTVREVFMALLVLVIGIFLVKMIFRSIGRKIFALANIKATTAATITKILHYFAYVMVALLALRLVNIPLAAFAFLGGAIAIGVGFGAQNLINNFISGFIMMAERPIAIGDLIEVDGILGIVEDIGARSTSIRTGRNIHILIPNSSFLENNIVNWTHSDKMIRASVSVGVAYGSSVTETRRLLLQAVKETPDIHSSPAPFVLFQDFGDNALVFEVYFWVQVNRPTEQRIIESNVRFRIDKLFAENGLVIAFPQRDVHLDTSNPLELRIART